jgi:predicted dehydrogenase
MERVTGDLRPHNHEAEWNMSQTVIKVALNGVTGRMGYRQHLVRSILAIREQGGVTLADGTQLMPEPILVGRSAERLEAIAQRHGIERWSTDLNSVLADPEIEIYFDSQVTSARETAITQAIAAGKHVYTEKPTADGLSAALGLAASATVAGVINGVVQDKLFLPGIVKLRRLIQTGFFGRILSIRLEFGYWVFDGEHIAAQRPSWNYRAQDGGGIALDMLPHWRYLLEDLFGPVTALYAHQATHMPVRWDEAHDRYDVTADDSCYAIVELAGGLVASLNSSWAVRVNRRELLEIQVDGTNGSAVAGLRECAAQPAAVTPMPVWNPEEPDANNYRAQWADVPEIGVADNAFKTQWESFLVHVGERRPFHWDLMEGAKGVQLAELAQESSATGQRVLVPELAVPEPGAVR